MVLEGTDFCVLAAKTNDDITAQTLLHVLLSEEMFGEPFFSEQSLRNLIMFMRGPMRGPMSVFLISACRHSLTRTKAFRLNWALPQLPPKWKIWPCYRGG